MSGTALEVAIALWRMPSMRTALRQRPLPDGVGEVIELAAGNAARIARVAGRLHEPEGEVLEAARFYVREVLLHDGNDAYRILGLSPDAGQAQVKSHHRALQHWLHPDRRGDDWDSIYAARINQAWSLLRTPERRARYDARSGDPAPLPPAPGRRLVTSWRPGPGVMPAWRRLAIPLLALAACGWLLVLAGRQATAPPPQWLAEAEDPADPALAGLRRAAVGAAPAVASDWQIGAARGDPSRASAAVGGQPPARAAREEVSAREVRTTGPSADDQSGGTGPTLARPAAPEPIVPGVADTGEDGPTAPSAPDLVSGVPSIQRVLLAEAAAREVTGYLRGEDGLAPPVWGSVAALDTAEVLRMRFGELDSAPGGGIRFAPPQWRISSAHATMTAAIEAGSPGAGGVLHLDLAWRDGMWLVEALRTEPRQ